MILAIKFLFIVSDFIFIIFFKMTKQKLTYTEAVAELELILKELESNEEINMDNIAAKVKRAAVLLDFCKKQLHELDSDIQKMMDELES